MTSVLALAFLALQATAPPLARRGVADEQDPDRPRLSVADFKSLADKNIFSPLNPKRVAGPPSKDPPPPSSAPKPRPPLVTGIFLDHASKAYHAVVEDRNDRSLKLFTGVKIVKVGDEVAGYRIESITADRVAVKSGEAAGEAGVGALFPANAQTALPAGGASQVPPPTVHLDDATRNDALEALKKRLQKKPLPEDDP